jgi:hypothetical protein
MVVDKKKIKKVILNYNNFNKFISFHNVVYEKGINKKRYLKIKGYFGFSLLLIPKNVIIRVNKDKKNIYIYFDSSLETFLLKYIYNNIIFLSYSVLYYHLIDIKIKGIGYKFELNKDIIKVYGGNSLPSYFNIPKKLKFLQSSNLNFFCAGSGDYICLNNFLIRLSQEGLPNKYKEIGIFLDKRL